MLSGGEEKWRKIFGVGKYVLLGGKEER